jgi:hypothetical protein
MFLVLCILANTIGGLHTMAASTQPKNLKWEWPDGRKPDRFLAIGLTNVAKEGGGLFGIRRSPSFTDTLPDARVLEGKVATGPLGGSPVRLRAPGGEIPGLSAGDRAAFGMIGDQVCICVLKVPAEVQDAQLADWTARQSCGG